MDLSKETVAVVGIPGSIATAAARILKPKCRSMLLVGRNHSARSRKIADSIDAEFTCDINDALARSRIVFSATSSGDCIDQKALSPSSIVIDVAVPTDVIGSQALREDCLVLTGGLSRIPEGNRIDSSYFFFQRGMIPSCLGETIVLSLEERAESYSLGQDLSVQQVLDIGEVAVRNGFNFTRLCSFGAAIDEAVINRFRKICRPATRFFVRQEANEGDRPRKALNEGSETESAQHVQVGQNSTEDKIAFQQHCATGSASQKVSTPGGSRNVLLDSGNGIGRPRLDGGDHENPSDNENGKRAPDSSAANHGESGNPDREPDSLHDRFSVDQAAGCSGQGDTRSTGIVQGLAKRARSIYRRHVNSVLVDLGESLVRTFVRGEGCYLWDDAGNRYLDFVAGFGSVNLGHNHPVIHSAIQTVMAEQAPGFVQASVNPLAAALAEKLVALSPDELDTAFFTNSGTESVEAALKTARIATGRTGFLYCRNSYHGKSFGSLSVTGNRSYQKPFEPLVPDCSAIDFGDVERLEAELATGNYAAFIVEPIQAEGGMVVASADYFVDVQRLCREAGTLLIIDEVQTGIGRLGSMFACEALGIQPDILTLAKSLSGGMVPIGAMLARGDIWKKAYGGLDSFALHTSTFGGGSLACAVALAALEVVQSQQLAERALRMGQRLRQGLEQLCHEIPILKEVRGEGLLLGLEMNPMNESVIRHWKDIDESMMSTVLGPRLDDFLKNISSMYVMNSLLNHHGIYSQTARSNPLVLRVQPPLVINQEQVDQFLQAIKQSAGEISYSTDLVDGLFARTGVGNSAE